LAAHGQQKPRHAGGVDVERGAVELSAQAAAACKAKTGKTGAQQ
jgi:hypothetical protein